MIATALTRLFELEHPIVLAPMGGVSGGRLAAAVSNAGGLGLVGGGYGDRAWLNRELDLVSQLTSRPWGVGLITWSCDRSIVDLRVNNKFKLTINKELESRLQDLLGSGQLRLLKSPPKPSASTT